MRGLSKTICFLLLLNTLFPRESAAQPAKRDSLILDSASSLALRQYHQFIAPEAGLYRGPEYVEYAHTIKTGHPYFLDSAINGSLLYNGVLYGPLPLLFDEVAGVVVIRDPYGGWLIGLEGERLDSFSIGDNSFVHLRDSLNPTAPRNGFYQLLAEGRTRLLRRDVKTVQTEPSFNELKFEKYVIEKMAYFLKKDTVYYAVNNRRSLLNALKDRNREVRAFMHSNHLKMRRDKETTLVKVITWYNGLTQ